MLAMETEISAPVLARLLSLVKQHTGITMEERKSAMLGNRIRKRMRGLGLSSFAAYLELLEKGGAEVQEFVNLVTTNETFFFRTPSVWDFFRLRFLPEWKEKRVGRPLRIWSAAASSGAEAYSAAICCEEARVEYRILGTDISTAILALARAGEYDGRIAEDFKAKHPHLLAKYFERKGDSYLAREQIRRSVEFSAHNLFSGVIRPAHFDFVFLRNVLIYFREAEQEQVLRSAAKAMAPEAYLALGESESLSRLKAGFEFVEPLIYRQGREP